MLRKVLKQFFFDIPNLHRHIKREVNDFYREGLCRLIKKELADHVGNEDTLEEASKIKELREDPEFVNMLFRRFHEDVLKCFGFKRIDAQGQAQMQGQGQTQMQGQGQMQAQQASGSRPSHGGLN